MLNQNTDGLNKAISNIETKIKEKNDVSNFELLFKMKLFHINVFYAGKKTFKAHVWSLGNFCQNKRQPINFFCMSCLLCILTQTYSAGKHSRVGILLYDHIKCLLTMMTMI